MSNLKRGQLPVSLVIFCLVLLVACQSESVVGPDSEMPTIEPQHVIHPDRLEGLNKRPLIVEGRGNCTLNQLEAREEGYRLSGGVGGLAVRFPGSEAKPVVRPAWVSRRWDRISQTGAPTQSVAVMVLDDFKGSAYTLDKSLYTLRYSDLEGVTADEKTASFEDYIDKLILNKHLSHGALVMEAVVSFIHNLEGFKVLSAKDERVVFGVPGKSLRALPPRIIVQAVDTREFNTAYIRDKLVASMQAINVSEGIERFVVNASFSIVPCSVLGDYRQSGIPSYEEYIKELAKHNDLVEFEQDILELTLEPLPNDPLELLFSAFSDFTASVGAENISIVASSGNYQLPYALSPARLDNVVAVSSADVRTGKLSGFSNDGQVKAFGAWFRLTDDTGRHGVGTRARAVVKAGTSFAAPAAAAALAADLMRTNPRCDNEGLQTSLLSDVPDNVNLRLRRAVNLYCNAP